ncbi:efflux RND transporter periplasmic adaptor subunit [Chitinophaga nivalis]|uniref:Efflux RND transporter periplasmic adaptor subunit n=1 Tax=Chitinophaga nivalis TaxID=2991709 RepID=A0ABT3IJA8_9BACT|nr:efflux RND transporter periplasmic adaptor subunit [Chitinophaga nivalis]MCW3466475.1 efflux RND transporter periplasmic adaptor subunit [Chitinophaga nivalis]MCW3483834.1 efflux RND transporter periplasmic adaptor subunit [Chitinophaga nivalis]
MQHLIKYYIPATVIISMVSILTGCGSAVTPEQPHNWALSDSLLRTLVVDTATARPIDNEVSLTGKITENEDKTARIFPMVSGIVTDVKVHSGDFVQKGQVLAVLKSPEMAGYTADQRISVNDMQTAKRNMDVAASFYQSGLSSQREYEEAKSNYDKAVAAHNKSQAVLEINGGAHMSNYLVKAPVPGFIISKKAAESMQWRPDNSDPIFVVADLNDVWAMINVFESDIASIREGDQVRMTTLSYPDKVFSGKIDKIYNVLDPENKVMKARVVVQNPGFLLKPEMFVRVKAHRHTDSNLVSIPDRGIIFDHDKYYVLVRNTSKTGVAIREVRIDKTVEGRAFISSGLKEGDQVIASRQVFIYETLKDQQ